MYKTVYLSGEDCNVEYFKTLKRANEYAGNLYLSHDFDELNSDIYVISDNPADVVFDTFFPGLVSSDRNLSVHTFRLFGRDGHRYEPSFGMSCVYFRDDSQCFEIIYNADITATNEYTEIQIVGKIGPYKAFKRVEAQVIDGIGENAYTESIKYLNEGEWVDAYEFFK